MAEIVAPPHNGYEAANMIASKSLWHYVTICLGQRQLYVYGVVAVLTLGYHVGEVQVRVWSAYQVGMMVGNEVVLYPLGHTSEYADNGWRRLLACHGMQNVEAVVDPVLGILAYGACVEEDGVGLVLVLADVVTGHLHYGGNDLRVGYVHLTSVCLNK